MGPCTDWKKHWDERSQQVASDFSFNRGGGPWEKEIENLSKQELLAFIDPRPGDVIFDAGCGTGGNMLLLHSRVRRIVGIDYAKAAVERCRQRLHSSNVVNVEVREGSIDKVPLSDCSVDKVLCLSVLHYMDDSEVASCLREFKRILKDRGLLILHVKNLSSLYLSTLSIGKRIKLMLGRQTKLGHFRPYHWYVTALTSLGFHIVDYNSSNLFILPGMPTWLVLLLQKLELRNHTKAPLRAACLRRHGPDLKIKALLRKTADA
jgi:ubiquinone/menaquinone biosynthesis C-methylase UbiE